ncbi:hypothetical protein DFJ73DRAFT_768777 [Zopfochytrium polystomum]|nr:hypothetical protein DFJ73DRAFT_768777 [Zopfochytrium polystomum]
MACLAPLESTYSLRLCQLSVLPSKHVNIIVIKRPKPSRLPRCPPGSSWALPTVEVGGTGQSGIQAHASRVRLELFVHSPVLSGEKSHWWTYLRLNLEAHGGDRTNSQYTLKIDGKISRLTGKRGKVRERRVFRHQPEDRAYYRMHGQVASRERNRDKRRKAQYIRYHLGKRLQVFLTDIQPSPTAASGQTKARFERARRRWITKLTAELGAEWDERFNPRIELNILAALERELDI